MIYSNFSTLKFTLLKFAKEKKHFSLLRLGDSEYTILSNKKKRTERFNRWFNVTKLPEYSKHILSLSNQIFRAYQHADFIGMPSFYQLRYLKFRNIEGFCRKNSIIATDKMIFDFNILPYFHAQGLIKELICLYDKIILVTSRNVKEKFSEFFNVENVEQILIPPESFIYLKYSNTIDEIVRNKNCVHYPDLFHNIRSKIDKYRDTLFLVGAGGLGKIYCDLAKIRGNAALDIGSLFDGWGGFITRPYLQKGIMKFKL